MTAGPLHLLLRSGDHEKIHMAGMVASIVAVSDRPARERKPRPGRGSDEGWRSETELDDLPEATAGLASIADFEGRAAATRSPDSREQAW